MCFSSFVRFHNMNKVDTGTESLESKLVPSRDVKVVVSGG